MVSFSLLLSLVAVSAAFYPSRHRESEENYGKYGSKYGDYGMKNGGYESGYEGSDYGHNQGNQGYQGKDYGVDDYSNEHSAYNRGGAEGRGDAHHDEGNRKAADADGFKKFSYFSSGSGPEGSYSRGSYGSEGYDHEDSKSNYAANANGGGFKKGFESDSKHNDDGHKQYGKSAAAHSGFGKQYDSAKFAHSNDKFDKEGHSNGWVNEAHRGAAAAHSNGY